MYSLVSSPFTYTYECLCVFIKKKKEKRFSVLSRRPTSVMYDIEKGFEGKSGFVSHTKLIAEATFMDLFHS